MVEQPKTAVTLDDIASMGDRWFEVVAGQKVYLWGAGMSPGFLHNQVAGNIYALLRAHVKRNNLGYACADGLEYVLELVEGRVQQSRLPDASYLSQARVPNDFDWTRPFVGAPDLAVEVVSPGNTANDLIERTADYFAAGTQEVWIVYPTQQQVYQYRSDASVVRVYQADETLESAVLPGLQATIADFFDV